MDRLDGILDRNIALFNERRINCAETVLLTMAEYLGADSPLMPRIATAFGGGMGGSQSVCGIVTGGLMAIGIALGRDVGGDQLPARNMADAFMRDFEAAHGTLTCAELTGVDMKDPEQMAAFRAPGGRHYTVCVECARATCRRLAGMLEGAR